MDTKQTDNQTPAPVHRPDAFLSDLLQQSAPNPADHPSQEREHLSKDSSDSIETQLIFEFYKQQREEYMNLAKERASLSIQFLLITGALVAAYLQNNQYLIQVGITIVIVFLGTIGLYFLISIDRVAQMHITRARFARDSLTFLKPIIERTDRFNYTNKLTKWRGARNDTIAWIFIYCGIIVVGTALLTGVILK